LSGVQWSELFDNKDVNEKWRLFKALLETGIERFVPVASNTRKKRCMWLNYASKKAIKSRNRFWKKYIDSKAYSDFMKYKRARNRVVQAVRRAKNKFEKS
jgi:hypothetical protein